MGIFHHPHYTLATLGWFIADNIYKGKNMSGPDTRAIKNIEQNQRVEVCGQTIVLGELALQHRVDVEVAPERLGNAVSVRLANAHDGSSKYKQEVEDRFLTYADVEAFCKARKIASPTVNIA